MFRQTAHVYDLIYEAMGKDYGEEAAVVDALIQERNPGARTLLDVACGTGGHLRHLRHSYEVVGIDVDPAMLREARRHLPETPLIEADMRNFDLAARFDAVICLFSSIGYMASTAELEHAIGAMARHLHADGVLVVDGWVRPDAWRGGGSTHIEVAVNDEMKVARVGRSWREGDTTNLEMHHLIATLDSVEHLVDRHRLTLFSPDEYHGAFHRAGLAVDVVESPMEGRDRYVGVGLGAG
jgi:SAM-dependent methyltransferase